VADSPRRTRGYAACSMLAGAWPALCRIRDSERLPSAATGSAVPVASRPLRCRSRSRLRDPRFQKGLRQSAVLSGGARAAPSMVPDRFRPFVATARRRHALSVQHLARGLQLSLSPLSAPKTETTTDLRWEPTGHSGKSCYPGLVAAFGRAV